jgi:hypothetical protein
MSKKIVISRDSLPDINSITGSYYVRFRIVSEDRNNISYWSPIFSTVPDLIYEWDEDNISISKSANHYNVLWEPVVIKKNDVLLGSVKEYDVWVQWSKGEENAEWIYKERIEGNSTTFFIPNEYVLIVDGEKIFVSEKPNQVAVEIYVSGFPIIRETELLRYSATN